MNEKIGRKIYIPGPGLYRRSEGNEVEAMEQCVEWGLLRENVTEQETELQRRSKGIDSNKEEKEEGVDFREGKEVVGICHKRVSSGDTSRRSISERSQKIEEIGIGLVAFEKGHTY